MQNTKVNLALSKAPNSLFYSKIKTKSSSIIKNKESTWTHLLTRLKQTTKPTKLSGKMIIKTTSWKNHFYKTPLLQKKSSLDANPTSYKTQLLQTTSLVAKPTSTASRQTSWIVLAIHQSRVFRDSFWIQVTQTDYFYWIKLSETSDHWLLFETEKSIKWPFKVKNPSENQLLS